MFNLNTNVRVKGIIEDFVALQNSKIVNYRSISEGFSLKAALKDMYNCFNSEKKFVDKKLRKLVSQVDMKDFAQTRDLEFAGKDESLEFFSVISKKLDDVVSEYEKFLREYKSQYLTDQFLKGLKNYSKEESNELRNEVRKKIQNLKEGLELNIVGESFTKSVRTVASVDFQNRIIGTNLEIFNTKLNSFLKKSGKETVEIIPALIFGNVGLLATSIGMEEAELKDEAIKTILSMVTITLVFYSSHFIGMYIKGINKYKNNLSLYIQDCITFIVATVPTSFGVGAPTFAALLIFLNRTADMGPIATPVVANTLACFVYILVASPLIITLNSVKNSLMKKFKSLKITSV